MELQLLVLIGVLVVIILSVLILSKVDKKSNCSVLAKSMVPKSDAIYACAYLDNNDNNYACGQWLQAYKSGQPCMSQNGSQIDCSSALNCCLQICPGSDGQNISSLNLGPNDTCSDNN